MHALHKGFSRYLFAFFCAAKILKPGQTVKVAPEDGGEILHISQVCMSKPVDGNRTYLKVVQGSQSFAACVLQKDKQESCSVDLFLSAREGIQLALEGGKNELSVIGYFEPEPESESDGDDDDMAGFGEDSEEESEDVSDDETQGMSAPVDGRIEDLDAQEEEANTKTQAGDAGSSKGDEATYKNALVEFLKKNGPTPLASLGQKVKKPASLPKMAAFLKAHANVFSVEGGKCSLK
ncbi:hypothetical protein cyc_06139 [Cyclospora cayetanensis]|uniref:Nucleoplasmin-like domain-containing protein n=1 Tax=Cyclospora cayetanensis TaxID=88456 RepID=A0A1D3CTM8_9EIME|nr:hypothetical protein cyc_06139 [Cyclospora cayetanensis]